MQVEAVSISHLRTIYLAHSLTILTEALADLAFEYEEVCHQAPTPRSTLIVPPF